MVSAYFYLPQLTVVFLFVYLHLFNCCATFLCASKTCSTAKLVKNIYSGTTQQVLHCRVCSKTSFVQIKAFYLESITSSRPLVLLVPLSVATIVVTVSGVV